jgi:hypothetical protein
LDQATATQRVEREVDDTHVHDRIVHSHDHYHVAHVRCNGPLGEFRHQSNHHVHERNHAPPDPGPPQSRNALARFNQTEFESKSAKERTRKRILAAADRFDIEVDESSNVSHPVGSLRATHTKAGPRGGRKEMD